ncbi:MAG: methyltransferase domain-containing protein [bacterium]|nr:methyltransferase domain-containing protein [bacterium]
MIVVDSDWWKTLFDEVYLLTDAQIVCNLSLTQREVDVIEGALCLSASDRVLDLCGGQGRHASELARRGYHHLTVADYTPFLLQLGQREASAQGLPVQFCRCDARMAPFRPASFDVALMMANSFGYFGDAHDDQRVLTEALRVLKPGGRFLLDLTDTDFIRRHFKAESWHETTDDVVVCWKRELDDDVIRVREMVISKTQGLLRDRTYAERLYTQKRLQALLAGAGFVQFNVQPNAFVIHSENGTDYGIATHRMLITATKR